MQALIERVAKVLQDLLTTALPRNISVPAGTYLALSPKIKVTINSESTVLNYLVSSSALVKGQDTPCAKPLVLPAEPGLYQDLSFQIMKETNPHPELW